MDSLAKIVDEVLASYSTCGGINHLNGVRLPSRPAVEEIVQVTLQILFPGFPSEDPLTPSDLPALTLSSLKNLRRRLVKEIDKSFECHPLAGQTSEAIAIRFLKALPQLRSTLQTDVEAAYEGDPAAKSTDEVMLAYPGIEAIAVQRMARLLYLEKVALIPRMMTEWAHSRTGIDLHPGADIGTHFFIDHGTGVVIGEMCVIGNHVRIYQGVTLGGRSLAAKVARDQDGMAIGARRHPTIGNHVTIYANATILGGDTMIGDHSTIGGNVWLTESIPAHSTVFLERQQIQIRPRNSSPHNWQI